MIDGNQKFRIPDSGGKNHIEAEVNWDESQKRCEMIKLTFHDGKKAFVKRDDLSHILFAIGDKETQMALTPQKISTVHHFRTVLGIEAKKDIKKGEMVNFPIELPVPCDHVRTVYGNQFLNEVQRKTAKLASKSIPLGGGGK